MLTCLIKITHLLHSLQRSLFSVRCLLVTLIAVISVFLVSSPAQAAVDKYVRRFLAKEPISLALDTLAGATPPRNNINGLVDFLREPMTYDGSEPTFWCRQVSETWMPQQQIEKLAAFVLRAAQKAPGWGTSKF